MISLKLGRKPRTFDPRIPHMSAIMAGKPKLAPAPITLDYAKDLPSDIGMMMNDTLGDCTIAGLYHYLQVTRFHTGRKPITEPDKCILQAYEEACGYNPGDPNSDQGGVEQDVLAWAMNVGLPTGDGKRDKILGFVEFDPRSLEDMKRIIHDCGGAYLGIDVPKSLFAKGEPPKIWDYDSKNAGIDGGHCVISPSYNLDRFGCVSWGRHDYELTHPFLGYFLLEGYGIIFEDWIAATGKTPLGMTRDQLAAQMAGMKQ